MARSTHKIVITSPINYIYVSEQGKGNTVHQLKRSIGLFQAIMYGIGLILGAGVYVIIGDVALQEKGNLLTREPNIMYHVTLFWQSSF